MSLCDRKSLRLRAVLQDRGGGAEGGETSGEDELERPDDRLLDPVVSAMPASDRRLESLDVLALGALGLIGVAPHCETGVKQRPKRLESLEWCPVSSTPNCCNSGRNDELTSSCGAR